MRHFLLMSCACAAFVSACSSSGEMAAPMPVANVTGPGPTAAALNTTVSQISYSNPDHGGDFNLDGRSDTVSEDIQAVTTSLRLNDNTIGFEFVERVAADFDTTDTASYDFNSKNLTFNLVQAGVDIQDTIGPLLLANPGDFAGLENDDIAIYVSAFPGLFISALNATGVDYVGLGFDPSAYFLNAGAADAAFEVFSQISGDDAVAVRDAINAVVDGLNSQDFFTYVGANGLVYSQLKNTGTNSGVTTTYAALGVWNAEPDAANPQDEFFGATIIGKPTPDGEVPTTGSATYNTTIVGWLLRQNAVENLRGGVDVNVDFEGRTTTVDVDADIAVTGPNGETLFSDFATLTGTGTFGTGNFFSGDLIGVSDTSLSGSFDGAFYGPTAEEVAGTLNFSNADVVATGVYAGPQN